MCKPLTIYKLTFIIGIWLLIITNCAAQTGPSDHEIIDKVDEYMQALTRLGWFSGSILIAKDGRLLVSKGYGMANLEYDIPNTLHTKFRLASLTKQFTTMAILILQEQGRLSVEDSVCRYLPDCPKAWNEITIRHLLQLLYPKLAAIVFEEQYTVPKRRQAIKVDSKILDSYVGQYEIAPNNIVTITKQGDGLMMQIREQPKVKLFPESESKFFRESVDLQVTFTKGDTRQVTHMIFHVDERDLKARRIK